MRVRSCVPLFTLVFVCVCERLCLCVTLLRRQRLQSHTLTITHTHTQTHMHTHDIGVFRSVGNARSHGVEGVIIVGLFRLVLVIINVSTRYNYVSIRK